MSLCLKSLVKRAQIVVGDASGAPTAQTIYDMDYATVDAAATVESAGYFNAAAGLLLVGSLITAVMAAAGTPVTKRYVVTGLTAGVVTIALAATTAG